MIAAGGTAGHVVPALAVADALRAEGAEVAFIGGERAEAAARAGRGLRAAPASRSRASAARNPLQALRALARAALPRCRARARCCARCTPTRCWAAAATSPGRSAWPRSALRIPLVLTEADSHLGLTNRAARAASPAACAWPSRSRGARSPATASPAARFRRAPADRDAARRALRHRRGGDLRARVRRLAGGALDQPRGGRGVRRGALPRAARQRAAATTPELATRELPEPATTCVEYLDVERLRRGARRPPTSAVARAGGSVFELAAHGAARDPRALSARRRRSPERQRALDGGGRCGRDRGRRRADAPRELAREVAALLADRGAPVGDGARRALAGATRGRPRGGRRAAGAAGAMSAAAVPWRGRRMHLVGVGGAGMSAYARAAHALGATVSGSDAAREPLSASAARRRGARTRRSGTRPRTSRPGRRSSSTTRAPSPAENPERVAARERGIPERPRAPSCWASCRRCGARSRSRAPTARPRPRR